jgi:hypothetical protein
VVHGGVRLPQVGSSDKIKDISISITGAVDANLENSRFVIPAEAGIQGFWLEKMAPGFPFSRE